MRKIAVPIGENNQVDDHFGHCKYFNIYTIHDDNKTIEVQTLPSTEGCGCKSNIAGVLAKEGVQLMLAGGIGGGAINVLNRSNIDVVRGCSGDVESLIKAYINGEIIDSGETCSSHKNPHECSH